MLATVAAALQRQHHESVIQHRVQPQHPAAAHPLRDGWQVGASSTKAATQSTNDRVSFREGDMIGMHCDCTGASRMRRQTDFGAALAELAINAATYWLGTASCDLVAYDLKHQTNAFPGNYASARPACAGSGRSCWIHHRSSWQTLRTFIHQLAFGLRPMQAPPGCSRYTVELRKPLGLVLEEDRHGCIFVVGVFPVS